MKKKRKYPMAQKSRSRFVNFSRPKIRLAKVSSLGKVYVDYKDIETLKRMLSINGKIQSRSRTGAAAFEQRLIASAIKRARFLGMLPYVGATNPS